MKNVKMEGKDGIVVSIMTSDDGKYFNMNELREAMNSNYIYSLAKAVSNSSSKRKIVIEMEVEGRVYKFVDLKTLLSEFEKCKAKIQSSLDRTLFASIRSCASKLKTSMEQIVVEERESTIENAIDVIMEKLVFIQSSKECQVDEAELERLKEEIKKSEAKYEELKNINLGIVKERDILKSENNELKLFKNSVMGLIKNG